MRRSAVRIRSLAPSKRGGSRQRDPFCIRGRRGFEPMRSRGVKRAGRWPARSRASERAAAAGRVAADAAGIRESARWLQLGLLISAASVPVLLFCAHDAATEHLFSLGTKHVSLFRCSALILGERSISSGERRDCKMAPNYFFKRSLGPKSEKLVLRYSDQFYIFISEQGVNGCEMSFIRQLRAERTKKNLISLVSNWFQNRR